METKGKKTQAKVSAKKIESVKKLTELLKGNETLIIASIKNLPSSQFQDIRKKLRGSAEVTVAKKSIVLKAIENLKSESLAKIKEYVQEDSALLFSKEDAFSLAIMLANNKNPIGGKIGQVSTEDIEVQEGPTEILPGPAISEFGSLGIKISVEEGKIAIKQNKVIVKKGEKITAAAAGIMSKLDIKPFKIGLEPIVLCDMKNGKIYSDIHINPEKVLEEFRMGAGKSVGFAQKINYYARETIPYLLGKANAQNLALGKLAPKENQ